MNRTFRSSSSGTSDYSMSTNLFSQSNESIISIPRTTTTTTQDTQRSKTNARKRGPRFTRIPKKSTPLLRRLAGTIFGDYELPQTDPTMSKGKSSSSTPNKNQFENNEKTFQSFVTLLSPIESKNSSNDQVNNERARNNNRIDDTCSSQSNETHHQEKLCTKGKRTNSSPMKISTHAQTMNYENSWIDLMREDRTTIDAWGRIRRRLKPEQQKDILRALMIICANLFEVLIENKQR